MLMDVVQVTCQLERVMGHVRHDVRMHVCVS